MKFKENCDYIEDKVTLEIYMMVSLAIMVIGNLVSPEAMAVKQVVVGLAGVAGVFAFIESLVILLICSLLFFGGFALFDKKVVEVLIYMAATYNLVVGMSGIVAAIALLC